MYPWVLALKAGEKPKKSPGPGPEPGSRCRSLLELGSPRLSSQAGTRAEPAEMLEVVVPE